MKKLISFALLMGMGVSSAYADEAAVRALQAEIAQLKSVIQGLSSRVEYLEGSRPVTVSAPAGPGSSDSFKAAAPASGRWNPEIGVIADTAAQFTQSREDAEGEDRLSVRELEVVFGSNVDAYSRLDATVSFSDFEEASLEEAYLTRYELPLGMTARVGRFLPRIGKTIPVHRDSLDTVDLPLVIQRWFGHHGYNKTGADLTHILDLPLESSHQVTFGVLEGGSGEEGTLFGDRRRPTWYSNLKNYWELGEDAGLEWGVSHMLGSKDDRASNSVMVIGTDLTYKHRFGESTILKLQGEAYHQNRRDTEYEVEDDAGTIYRNDLDGSLWGGYGLADLRFHPQWSAGFRGDAVELVDNPVENPDFTQFAYTGYLTFYQSEFARWRVQATRFEDVTGEGGDWQLMLQGTFAIGEHNHKIV